MKAELVDIKKYADDVYELFIYSDSGLKVVLLDEKSLKKISEFNREIEDGRD